MRKLMLQLPQPKPRSPSPLLFIVLAALTIFFTVAWIITN